MIKARHHNFDGNTSHARHDEKIKTLLLFLAQFGVTTKKLASELLGVSHKGQGAFFKGLVDKGYLLEQESLVLRHRILKLGEAGRLVASAYTDGGYIKSVNRITTASLLHDLTMQQEAIKRREEGLIVSGDNYFSEKGLKQPDFIIMGNERIAYEIEKTQKNKAAIYLAFFGHVQNIKRNMYDKVVYIFINKGVMNAYINRYSESRWPNYVKTGSKYELKGKVAVEKLHDQNLFLFKLGELYR